MLDSELEINRDKAAALSLCSYVGIYTIVY